MFCPELAEILKLSSGGRLTFFLEIEERENTVPARNFQ
jgi:hypothetical protein